MHEQFFYFDIVHAVEVHDWIIEHSGGKSGNNNLQLLESPLESIQNDLYYPAIEDKLTHLVYSINKNHAFVDGNKRSCIALGAYFLELNGYGYSVKSFVREMENIVVCVAANIVDKDLLHEITSSLIYEGDYSEHLKFKIAMAVMEIEESLEC